MFLTTDLGISPAPCDIALYFSPINVILVVYNAASARK